MGSGVLWSIPLFGDFRADALQKPFARNPGPDCEEEHEMCGELWIKRGKCLIKPPTDCNGRYNWQRSGWHMDVAEGHV